MKKSWKALPIVLMMVFGFIVWSLFEAASDTAQAEQPAPAARAADRYFDPPPPASQFYAVRSSGRPLADEYRQLADELSRLLDDNKLKGELDDLRKTVKDARQMARDAQTAGMLKGIRAQLKELIDSNPNCDAAKKARAMLEAKAPTSPERQPNKEAFFSEDEPVLPLPD